ncbi:MAG: sugar ABC transporter permease [Verrucomicrobia bacterium]|nr:sugar ABC transporter permease [Verrucomicrobiota bacterium]
MEPANKAQRASESLFKYAMLGPAVLWVIAFTFFPIFSALNYSFSNYVLGRGITNYVGLKNYYAALTDPGFWPSLLITVIYVGVAVPVEVCLGFLFAWIITVGLPGKGIFRSVLTAPLFTMEVAIGYLGVTLFTSQGGLVSVLLNLIHVQIPWMSTGEGGLAAAIILDVWQWTPFVFLMALAALGSIPDEIYDAAMLEASSHWQVLRHVGLPLAWPVLTVAILLRLIEGLKTFGLPFALTSGGPGTSTQLFSIMNYLITIQFFDFGRGSAMGILYLIMVSVIITVFFQQMRKRID